MIIGLISMAILAGVMVLLGLVGPHRIDDIRIDPIRAEDMPDAGPYLTALAGIPEAMRKGGIPLPQFRSGRKDGTPVAVRFDGRFSFLEWARQTGK